MSSTTWSVAGWRIWRIERANRILSWRPATFAISPDDKLFADAEYVFHFAGIGDIVPSIERPVDYLSINVMGTVKVLECARHARVASSSMPPPPPATASPQCPPARMPRSTRYPYALSKYMGEEAVLHWGQVYQLPVNSIRIFNAYGTRSKTSGAYGAVFGVFLAQKLAGKPFTVVGDGTQRRDFLFVTDVARAFFLAATTGALNEIYNLGAGNPQTVNHLDRITRGAKWFICRSGRANPIAPGPTSPRSAISAGNRRHVRGRRRRMLQNIDYWRQARFGMPLRSTRRPRLGSHSSQAGPPEHPSAAKIRFRRKIKTREELREAIGDGRGRSRSSCATAPSTWCIRAISGT